MQPDAEIKTEETDHEVFTDDVTVWEEILHEGIPYWGL